MKSEKGIQFFDILDGWPNSDILIKIGNDLDI